LIRLLFLVALFAAVFWFWTTWKNSDPVKRRKMSLKAAFGAFLGVLLMLVVTGRLHVLVAAIAAVIPYVGRLLPLLSKLPLFKKLWSQRNLFLEGVAKTALLLMTRDAATGKLSGEVLQGEFTGSALDALDPQALLKVYELSRASSPDSILLLQAYFEQRFGLDWRQLFGVTGNSRASSDPDAEVADAYLILGLENGASLQQVLEAHRRLIQRVHPDRGGSNFLAAQINRAKDVLARHLT
jgi:hypothetical protein